jgi:hypothetical protein
MPNDDMYEDQTVADRGEGNPPVGGMFGGEYQRGHRDDGLYQPPQEMQPQAQAEGSDPQGTTPTQVVPEAPPQEAPASPPPSTIKVNYGGQDLDLTPAQAAEIAQYGIDAYQEASQRQAQQAPAAQPAAPQQPMTQPVPQGVNPDGTPAQVIEKSPYVAELEGQISELSEGLKQSQQQIKAMDNRHNMGVYNTQLSEAKAANEDYQSLIKDRPSFEASLDSAVAKALYADPSTPIADHVATAAKNMAADFEAASAARAAAAAKKANTVPTPSGGAGVAGSEPFRPNMGNLHDDSLRTMSNDFLNARLAQRE